MPSISRLFVELGGKSTLPADLQTSLAALENVGQKATYAGKRILTSFNEALNPTKRLREEVLLLKQAGQSNADIVKVMGDRFKTAAAQTRAMGQAVDPVIGRFEKMAIESGKTHGALNILNSGLSKVKNMLGNFGIALGAYGIFQAFKKIIASSVRFESAFAGVRKTVEATEPEFKKLSDEFRRMSTVIPISASELAKIGEAAGQLGIKTENIATFTRTMAALGVTTNLSSTEAATALARLANIMGTNQQDFDKLGSTIVYLGNNFATTESEIVEFAMRLAAAGKQVGMSEADILALGATLSSVGINAEAGGTAFSKVFINIAAAVAMGGEKLEQFARVAGLTVADFKELFKKDAAGAISAFVDGLGKMEGQGKSAILVLNDMGITEVRMRNALLASSSATGLLEKAIYGANEAYEENIALLKEESERLKTTESRWKIFADTMLDVGRSLGDVLAPALTKVASKFSDLVKRIRDYNDDRRMAREAIIQRIKEFNSETDETIIKTNELTEAEKRGLTASLAAYEAMAKRNTAYSAFVPWTDESAKAIANLKDETEKLNEENKKMEQAALKSRLDQFYQHLDESQKTIAENNTAMAASLAKLNAEYDSFKTELGDLPTEPLNRTLEQFKDVGLTTEELPESVGKVQEAVSQFGTEVSTIFTDFSRNISDAILEWKGFGEALKDLARSFGELVLRTLIEKLFDPVKKLLNKMIDSIFGLFTGGGGTVGSTVGSSTAGMAGTAATAAGGAASMGISLISGGVSGLVSGLVGAMFQGNQPEHIRAIEQHTRGMLNQLVQPGGIQDRLNEFLPALPQINDSLNSVVGSLESIKWDVLSPRLTSIDMSLSRLPNLTQPQQTGTSSGDFKIYLDGQELTKSFIEQIETNRGGAKTSLNLALGYAE